MQRNDIYMIQGEDYRQMAIEVLRAAKLAEDIGNKNKKIGIKPNILGAIKASQGATTHPELVDGVLSYLLENGFTNLVVLEGAWVGDSTARAVKVCGIYDVCSKYQVPFVDLQKDSFQKVDASGMSLAVCDEALTLDYLINMPVIKGHCQTKVTCALKNSKGLIPNSEKRRFHTMGLHKPIAHLNAAIHQDFILVDNICGDLDFEEGGNPVVMNRVLGFKDPVLCDSFAAECIGYHPYDVEYIRLAEKLGLGSTDLAHARLISLNEGVLDGEALNEKALDEKVSNEKVSNGKTLNEKASHEKVLNKKALDKRGMEKEAVSGNAVGKARQVERLAAYVEPKDACSACYGALIYALARMEKMGELRQKREKSLAIGQGYRGETGEIGIGQCTRCFKKTLGGCPPKAVDIVEFLKREW